MEAVTADKVFVPVDVSVEALGEALGSLTPEQVIEVLSAADDEMQDWELVRKVYKWVIPHHRTAEKEDVTEESRARGCCVRSAYYPDIQVHSDPHRECILR